jgi:hypothetical protein
MKHAMKFFAYEDEILCGLIAVALLIGAVATFIWRDQLFYGWRKASLWEKAFHVAMTPILVVWNGFVVTSHLIISACFFVVVGLPLLLIDFLFPPKPLPPPLPYKYVPPAQKKTLRKPLEFKIEAERIARNRVVDNLKAKGINPRRVSMSEINVAAKEMVKADWESIRADAEMSFHENEMLAKIRDIAEYGGHLWELSPARDPASSAAARLPRPSGSR